MLVSDPVARNSKSFSRTMKDWVRSVPVVQRAMHRLNNQNDRDAFVHAELAKLPGGARILDAGCGSQRYRPHCAHLDYNAQDFGKYTTDEKTMISGPTMSGAQAYQYGKLDYTGDIWNIAGAETASFDAILCTEVFEHIPYPNETVKEFRRLLKPGGRLILTAPANCLRHMDPYYFYAGFSDRWYEHVMSANQFRLERVEPVGDYYRWLAVELFRTGVSHSLWAKAALLPAFLYFYNKTPTQVSVDSLCEGYHIVATAL